MKKIVVLLILLSILMLNAYSKQTDFSFSKYFSSGTITCYATDTNIKGESIYFENLEIDNALKTLKANVVFKEYIKEKRLTILYCLSPLINKTIVTKNKEINLQIAVSNNYVVLGWPMILGSF